jgi:hypothetical protein
VTIALDLDCTGSADVATGVGFYDHLLSSLAHHGLFDLEIRATGDLHVDEHHTVEDVALVLGAAFAEALGDRAGIRRFGDSTVPMDEAVATAVIDVGGRPSSDLLPGRAAGASLSWSNTPSRPRTSGATLPCAAADGTTTTAGPRSKGGARAPRQRRLDKGASG